MKASSLSLFLLAAVIPCAVAQDIEVNVAQFKPTFGDTAFGAPTSRGNDGVDGTSDAGNWTHADYPTSAVAYPGEVDVAPNPYWQVDLGEPFDLHRIQLVDRVGCCDPQRLEGSTITLLDFEGEVIGAPIEVIGLAPNNPVETAVIDFDNGGLGWAAVSAVRIDGLPTNQYFQFSEFRAFSMEPAPPYIGENAALGALVTASAATWGGQGPEMITDGNYLTQSHPLADVGTIGFTYTVDLGMSFNLEELVLWNRLQGNCCQDRLTNYRVSLHEDDGVGAPGPAVWTADLRTDGSNSGLGGSDRLTADLDAAGTFAGRFIVVENLSDAAYNPQIAEIEAFTFDEIPVPPEPPTNFALNAVVGYFAMDGTPVGAWGSLPVGNAVDGNPSSFTHPLDMVAAGHYLEIDMGEDVVVGTVEITGRIGCCPERLEDATFELLDSALNVVATQVLAGQLTLTETLDFSTSQPTARFIRIHNSNGADYGPQLGEVQVFAPEGPATPLVITAVSVMPATGMTVITFDSVPGASYMLFGSSSLAEAFWEELDDSILSQGDETTIEFTDSLGAGQPTRLYRIVRVTPAPF